MTEIPLILTIDGTKAEAGANRVKSSLKGVTDEGGKTAKAVNSVDSTMQKLARTAAVLGVSFSVSKLVQYSDTWKSLEGRLKLVTTSMQQTAAVQNKLFDISQRTRASYEATATLFTRIALSSRNLGKSQEELLRITETVNKALVIGGASSQEAQAGVIQLSQALAAGTLRGDEFKSVLENMPRVAQALEQALGKTRGELIAMSQAGQLTSKAVADALLSMSKTIDDEFTKIPKTVGQALTQLDNALLRFIGRSSAIATGTNSLAIAIGFLADNFDLVAKSIIVVAAVKTATLIPALAASARAFGVLIAEMYAYISRGALVYAANLGIAQSSTAASIAVAGLTRALLVVPWVALATLIAAAATTTANVDKATERYGETLLKMSGYQSEFIKASAERRKQIIDDTQKIIQAQVSELAGLMALIRGYQNMSALRLGMEEVGNRVRTVMPGMDDRDAPSEVLKKAEALKAAIAESKKILADFGNGNDTAGIESVTDKIKKFNEALEDAINKKTIENYAIGQGEVALAMADIDAWSAKAVDGVENLTAKQKAQISVLKELTTANIHLKTLQKAYDDTRTPAERAAIEIRELQDAINDPRITVTPQRIEAVTRKIQQLQDEVDPTAQAFKDMATSIRGAFTDTFEKLFSGQLKSFKDFAGSIKDIFIKMLAEMATLAIAKPIIIPLVQSIGGIMGMSGSSIAAVTGQMGGAAGGDGTMGSIASLAASIGLSNGVGTDLFSGLLGSVNNFGANVFGTAAPLPWSGSGAGTLTSNIASTFSGSWGGAIAGLMGLGSGNMLVDTGTSLAGAAIGNLLLPGIGGILGSFAGTALGGMFGGGTPHPASVFGATGFNADTGGLELEKFTSKHMDTKYAEAIFGTLDEYFKGFKSSTGVDLTRLNASNPDLAVTGGFDRESGFVSLGYYKNEGAQVFKFDQKDEESINKAFAQLALAATKAAEDTTQTLADYQITALNKIETEGRKAQEILDDLTLVTTFDKLYDRMFPETEVVSAVQQSMDAINERFKTLRTRADELGLPLSVLDDQLAKIKERIAKDFNKDLGNQLLNLVSPLSANLANEQARFEAQLSDAKAAGANLNLVYKIHAQLVQQIEQQYGGVSQQMQQAAQEAQQLADSFTGIVDSFDDLLYNLKTGSLSPLSPGEQYQTALGKYNDVSGRAKLGDVDAMKELPQVAQSFLEISKSYYGTTSRYGADFDRVTADVTAARDVAVRQVDIQTQIAENTAANVASTDNLARIMEMIQFSQANQSANLKSTPFNSTNANVIASMNSSAIKAAGMGDLIESLLNTYSYGSKTGAGARRAFFEQFSYQNEAVIAEARRLGIPGFATGGYPMRGSPSLVGERGAEIRADLGSSAIIPIQNNAEMLYEMQEQNKHLSATVMVLQEGLQQLVGENRKISKAMLRMADEQRRSNAPNKKASA